MLGRAIVLVCCTVDAIAVIALVELSILRGVVLRVSPVLAAVRSQLCRLKVLSRLSRDRPSLNYHLIPTTEFADLTVLSRASRRVVGRPYVCSGALPATD